MMKEEFEKLTGIYPSNDLYGQIEAAYMEFNGDKAAFCKAYIQNTDSIAERIQLATDKAAFREQRDHKAALTRKDIQIKRLERELEQEQGWKPHEIKENVQQVDYERLAQAGDTEDMTDERCKDLLYNWYGFAKEKITILRAVPKYEVNRHGQLRKIGEIQRNPLYNATDWNYIRFDCGCMTYELHNDKLRPFLH